MATVRNEPLETIMEVTHNTLNAASKDILHEK